MNKWKCLLPLLSALTLVFAGYYTSKVKFHIPKSIVKNFENNDMVFFAELRDSQNERIGRLADELLAYRKNILYHQWNSAYQQTSGILHNKFSFENYSENQKKIMNIFFDISGSSLTDSTSFVKTVYEKKINNIPIFGESQDMWSFNELKNKWELLKTAEFVP